MASTTDIKSASALKRIVCSTIVAAIVASYCIYAGATKFAFLAGWDALVLVYGAWVWSDVWHMSAADTRSHAVRENPGRAAADILLLFASVASIVAVGILVIDASKTTGSARTADVVAGLVSIILSWATVHTTYMLKYARLYYGQTEGGIDFNQKDSPRYSDFAYMAFTLGMTFQVSDTELQTKEIRSTALKHALLAYLFGTVIIATTINALASLTK